MPNPAPSPAEFLTSAHPSASRPRIAKPSAAGRLASRSLLTAALAVILGGCVVAPARVAGPPAAVVRQDPYCAEERQEARVADRVADRERREARYGGARQDYQADVARAC